MKMYSILLLVYCFTFCNSVKPKQELPCSKVHTGNFNKIDENFGIYKINRSALEDNKFIQVEHVVKSKLKLEFSGTWIDDCTCELRFSKVLENGIGYDFEKMLKDVVRTEQIMEIKRDSTNEIIEYKIKTTSNQHNESYEEILMLDNAK